MGSLDDLQQRLDARGLHLTRHRAAVFNHLSKVHNHPTAQDVHRAIRRKMPTISLATVYNNLETLVSCGAISKLTYGDGSARYDVRTDHHYHARCLECGSVRDVEASADLRFPKSLGVPDDFDVSDYRVELLGRCGDCA